MRKIIRSAYYLGTILLFVIAVVAGLSQTRAFKDALLARVLAFADSTVHGSVKIERIDGNLITGLVLSNVSVEERGLIVLKTPRIEVRYDPLSLLIGRISLSRTQIARPEITIVRSSDGTWNVGRLIPTSDEDTSSSNIVLSIKQARLDSASIRVIDSLALRDPDRIPVAGAIDYADISVKALNLTIGVDIDDGGTTIRVDQCSAVIQGPVIHVRSLSGTFLLMRERTEIRTLRVETDGSRMGIDASLERGLSAIGTLASLERVPVSLMLRAEKLDLRELRRFLDPWVDFLDESVGLTLTAHGPFGNLTIDRLSLQTPQSFIQLRGTISSLHQPADLTLDIEGGESVASSPDLHARLPGLTLPDWSRFGEVRFFTSFKGKPLDFAAQVYAMSGRGTVDIKASMKIGQTPMYNGTVQFRDFDLQGFSGDAPAARLNGTATVNASGTSLRTMIGLVKVEIDSSEVEGLPITRSIAVMDVAEGAVNVHLSAGSAGGKTTLSGRARFDRTPFAQYQIRGELREADLGKLTGVEAYESDLNLKFRAEGTTDPSGSRVDSLVVDLEPSRIAGRELLPSTIIAQYRILDSVRQEFRLTSDPVVMAVTGEFSIPSLVQAITHSGDAIARYSAAYIGQLDSLRGFARRTVHSPVQLSVKHEFAPIEARIDIDVRDLFVPGVFLRTDVSGMLNATIEAVGTPDDYQISGTIRSEALGYRDSSATIETKNAGVEFFFDGMADQSLLETFTGTVSASAGRMSINGRLFSETMAEVSAEGDSAAISVSTELDSTARFLIGGSVLMRDHLLKAKLPDFRLDINGYSVSAVNPVEITVGRDGFSFESFNVSSAVEEYSLEGYFIPGGVSDFRFSFKDFLAGNLRTLLRRTPYASLVSDVSGIAGGRILFRGTLDHPNIDVETDADGVRLQETVFGRFSAKIGYFEGLLTLFAHLQNSSDDSQTQPDLLLQGTVPYQFTLVGVPEEPTRGDINLELRSQGLDLRFLEPFLYTVTRALRGTLSCNIRMLGSVENPRYEGSASIRNGRFLFVPTRMEYLLDGDLVPDGNLIRLKDVVIRNTPTDLQEGKMNAAGSLALSGISLKGFDLQFDGMLRAMKEDSSRLMGNKYYGDLTAETGPNGLVWQGNSRQSKLSGTLLLRNAGVTLPPDREMPRYSARLIEIVLASDSQQQPAHPEPVPAATATQTTGDESTERTFVDGIDFDLQLVTQGPTQVRFIFNRQTNDVLFADLRGRMSFLKSQTATRLTGEVDVTNRSYYNFLKRFNATGKILFTGNPLVPELDITATYEGVHRKLPVQDLSTVNTGAPQAARDEQVTVTLYLKGPREKLETRFDVDVKSAEGNLKREGDVEADAIAFIMTGQFRDELTEQQRTGLLGQNLGYGLASGLLTGPLSEALRRSTKGSIQSLDVIYYGGSQFTSGTDVRLTGQFGEAIYRVGGRVFNDINNTNVVVEVPISSIVQSQSFRNLVLTLERRVDGVENLDDRRRASNGARLMYRISF